MAVAMGLQGKMQALFAKVQLAGVGEPAPLYGTDAAPVPAGAAAEWFAGAGGARLRAALLPAGGAARGSVVAQRRPHRADREVLRGRRRAGRRAASSC